MLGSHFPVFARSVFHSLQNGIQDYKKYSSDKGRCFEELKYINYDRVSKCILQSSNDNIKWTLFVKKKYGLNVQFDKHCQRKQVFWLKTILLTRCKQFFFQCEHWFHYLSSKNIYNDLNVYNKGQHHQYRKFDVSMNFKFFQLWLLLVDKTFRSSFQQSLFQTRSKFADRNTYQSCRRMYLAADDNCFRCKDIDLLMFCGIRIYIKNNTWQKVIKASNIGGHHRFTSNKSTVYLIITS